MEGEQSEIPFLTISSNYATVTRAIFEESAAPRGAANKSVRRFKEDRQSLDRPIPLEKSSEDYFGFFSW